MTTRPYELLARFAPDGSIAGVSVRTITTVNGRDYESDPAPLSGATDPAFSAFAATFSAAIVAQRDQLVTDKTAMELLLAAVTAERDALTVNLAVMTGDRDALATDKQSLTEQLATLTSERDAFHDQLASSQFTVLTRDATIAERDQRISELEGQLEALLHPVENPRHVAPYVFLSLLKAEEIIALQTSVDPVVIVGRAKLQTIITYVDLDNEETVGLVRYMESNGLCAEGRADQILAGEPPS